MPRGRAFTDWPYLYFVLYLHTTPPSVTVYRAHFIMMHFSQCISITRETCRGRGCPPASTYGAGAPLFVRRGRREHGEQIEASTRAVYPGSGRDERVKPYSCLVCINWGARELGELATPSVWLSGFRMSEPSECPNPPNLRTPSTLHTGLLL